jgi:drug/metabolite transporter (DMT)-like permease
VSLAVAVPLGVASALVYGTSIVVQHGEAARHRDSDATGLLALLGNPRWLLAIGADLIGFLLQVAALSAGSVVLVQPLVVLMLPVALVVGRLAGGPKARRDDYLGCIAVVGGVSAFLTLIGTPGPGRVPRAGDVALTVLVVLGVGIVACLVAGGRGRLVRGAVYGAVAGAYFGTLGVMVDAAATRFADAGWAGLLLSGQGLMPLVGVVVLGGGGILLTQVSFQVGALAATLPASLSADPLVGVLIGALLLREDLPLGPRHLIGYALCLAAVVAGTIRLAEPATEPHPAARMAS